MWRRASLAAAILVFGTACSSTERAQSQDGTDAGADAPPPDAGTDASPGLPDFTPLAATAEAERAALGASGAAVVVRMDGKIVFARGFGTAVGTDRPIRTSTLFRVASLVKMITASAALELVDGGKLTLDTKIGDVLSGFSLQGAPPEAAAITLRQLLSHRSGISDISMLNAPGTGPGDDGMLQQWVGSAWFQGNVRLLTPPGRTFNYSNVGFTVAGAMMEKAAGRTWRDLTRAAVLQPLGMDRVLCTPTEIVADGDFTAGKGPVATFAPDDGWSPVFYPSGAGSACHASADDLSKLAQFVLDGDTRVLSSTSLAAMKDAEPDPEQAWLADRYRAYAYGKGLHRLDGVAIDGTYYPMTIHGHEGSHAGYASLVEIVPERKLTFVALANGHDAYFDDTFAHTLKLAGLPAPAPMPPRGVDPAIYPSLAGTYADSAGVGDVVVRQAADKLVADVPSLGVTGRELTPKHLRSFELLDVKPQVNVVDPLVYFVPAPDGAIAFLRNRYWVAARK
jgi:CubicO group peptidase (beta-lactamase class C family)